MIRSILPGIYGNFCTHRGPLMRKKKHFMANSSCTRRFSCGLPCLGFAPLMCLCLLICNTGKNNWGLKANTGGHTSHAFENSMHTINLSLAGYSHWQEQILHIAHIKQFLEPFAVVLSQCPLCLWVATSGKQLLPGAWLSKLLKPIKKLDRDVAHRRWRNWINRAPIKRRTWPRRVTDVTKKRSNLIASWSSFKAKMYT